MRTLIIPCAGRTLLNGIPKFLIRHPDGKFLVRKSMEGMPVDAFDRIIISILKIDVDAWHAEEVIKEAFTGLSCVEVMVLESETSGPAETVYRTIRNADVKGGIVIKDSDNFVRISSMPYKNFVAGLDLNEWDRDIYNLRNKSFMILNEQKQILDIYEKQFRSDVISLGLYGFAEAKDFIFAYERLDDRSYPIRKLYVSHVISYLIGYAGKVFYCIPGNEYETWGNDKVWNGVQRDYATYFIDLDKIELANENVRLIVSLQKRGARFVGFTSGGNSREEISQKAKEQGIEFLEIICNCTYSCMKRVIGTAEELVHIKDEEI